MKVSPFWKNNTEDKETQSRWIQTWLTWTWSERDYVRVQVPATDLLGNLEPTASFPISTSVPLLVKWERCHLIHRAVIRAKWDVKRQ